MGVAAIRREKQPRELQGTHRDCYQQRFYIPSDSSVTHSGTAPTPGIADTHCNGQGGERRQIAACRGGLMIQRPLARLLALVCSLVLFSVAMSTRASAAQLNFTVRIPDDPATVTSAVDGDRIAIRGKEWALPTQPGTPALPYRTVRIVLPRGRKWTRSLQVRGPVPRGGGLQARADRRRDWR
jgi:hypothetical protein